MGRLTHYVPKSASDNQKEIEVFSAVVDWLWENGYQPIFVPMNTVAPDDDREAAHGIMAVARHGHQALLIDQEIFLETRQMCIGNAMQRLLRVFTAR